MIKIIALVSQTIQCWYIRYTVGFHNLFLLLTGTAQKNNKYLSKRMKPKPLDCLLYKAKVCGMKNTMKN